MRGGKAGGKVEEEQEEGKFWGPSHPKTSARTWPPSTHRASMRFPCCSRSVRGSPGISPAMGTGTGPGSCPGSCPAVPSPPPPLLLPPARPPSSSSRRGSRGWDGDGREGAAGLDP